LLGDNGGVNIVDVGQVGRCPRRFAVNAPSLEPADQRLLDAADLESPSRLDLVN
jgi:hypothetical protein